MRKLLTFALLSMASLAQAQDSGTTRPSSPDQETLKKRLTPLQFEITQKNGTEPPFDNAYWDNKYVTFSLLTKDFLHDR